MKQNSNEVPTSTKSEASNFSATSFYKLIEIVTSVTLSKTYNTLIIGGKTELKQSTRKRRDYYPGDVMQINADDSDEEYDDDIIQINADDSEAYDNGDVMRINVDDSDESDVVQTNVDDSDEIHDYGDVMQINADDSDGAYENEISNCEIEELAENIDVKYYEEEPPPPYDSIWETVFGRKFIFYIMNEFTHFNIISFFSQRHHHMMLRQILKQMI